MLINLIDSICGCTILHSRLFANGLTSNDNWPIGETCTLLLDQLSITFTFLAAGNCLGILIVPLTKSGFSHAFA